MHSCRDVNAYIPELPDIGLDALNLLEVQAGMDPVYFKRIFGDGLVVHGGISAALRDHPDQMRSEMERAVPIMKQKGGYVLSLDDSVPSSVSLNDFQQVITLAKELETC
ncbi:MAG: hypothetical protein V3U24_03480 [Candidatus Neomarinimicrobiota bacterium]